MSRRISLLTVGAVVAVVLRAVPLSGVPMQTRTVSNPSDRRIERLDPALDRLIASDAKIEVLGQGYSWSEGPVWVKDGGISPLLRREGEHGLQVETGEGAQAVPEAIRLHRPARPEARRWDRTASRSTPPAIWCSVSTAIAAWPAWTRRSRARRRRSPRSPIATRTSASTAPTISCSRATATSTSPIRRTAWRRDGTIRRASCPSQGVSDGHASGEVTLLTRDMTRPNGLAFSPDEKLLYVAQSDETAAIWRVFDVKPDGTIANEPRALRRHALAKTKKGSARRHEGRQRGQSLRDRPWRRPGALAARQTPRHRS